MFDKNIICTYLYTITKSGYPPRPGDTLKYIDEMAKLGFRSVELEGIREPHLKAMYDLRWEIRKALDERNLEVPFFCVVLPGLACTGSVSRKKQLRLFEKGCEAANTLGARGVLDNAPLPPYVFPGNIPLVRHNDERVMSVGRLPRSLRWGRFWSHLCGTFQEVCDIAVDHGLTYHIHPAVGLLASSADGFLYFSEAVNRPNLRFVIDTANQFVMKENLSLVLHRLRHLVDYIHLSDNRGTRVEHLKPGDGSIRWAAFFETLAEIGYNGHIGIDIGGKESEIADLDEAYRTTARWLESKWRRIMPHHRISRKRRSAHAS